MNDAPAAERCAVEDGLEPIQCSDQAAKEAQTKKEEEASTNIQAIHQGNLGRKDAS